MTPADRIAELKDMLPGVPDFVLHCLASDVEVSLTTDTWKQDFVKPLLDVMKRLRFTEQKLARLMTYCGQWGAAKANSVFCYQFKQQRDQLEQAEFTVLQAALQQVEDKTDPDQVEAAMEAANEMNRVDDQDPYWTFDLDTVMLYQHCERVLKRTGSISQRDSLDVMVRRVRHLTKRCQKRGKSPEEVMGLTPPRSQFPDVLFRDGFFGDGTRLESYTDKDGVQRFRRTSKVEPLVGDFVGMNPMDIQLLIRKRLDQRKQQAQQPPAQSDPTDTQEPQEGGSES